RRARHGLPPCALAGARGAARARHPELRGQLGRDLDPRVGRAMLGGRRAPRAVRTSADRNPVKTWRRTPVNDEIGTHRISHDRFQRGAASGLALLVVVLVVLALWWFQPWRGLRGSEPVPEAEPRAVAARGSLAEVEQNNIDVFKTVSPSVVHITTLALQRGFFSLDVLQVPRGTGSGFMWDEHGHIVTNYHVIEGASGARVTLQDQSTWNAALVGAFPDRDLAVLRIDAPREKIKPILIGVSRDLLVGQAVYAIGNPFGLDQTLTT